MIQPVASSYSKTAVLWIWRAYLIVAILQGISALVLLGGAKSGADVDFWLGLSRTRLVIVLGVGLILLALGWLLIETWFSPSRSQMHIDRLAGWLSRPAVWGVTGVVSALIFLA